MFTQIINFKNLKEGDMILRMCPGCGRPMKYLKVSETYEIYICEECDLSSDLPEYPPVL